MAIKIGEIGRMKRGALGWRFRLGEVALGLGRRVGLGEVARRAGWRAGFGRVVGRLKIGIGGPGHVGGLGRRLGLDRVGGWLDHVGGLG
jgi:hypothetical protein